MDPVELFYWFAAFLFVYELSYSMLNMSPVPQNVLAATNAMLFVLCALMHMKTMGRSNKRQPASQETEDIDFSAPFVVLVHASWCPACKNYLSSNAWITLQEKMSEILEEDETVNFTMLDIDRNQDIVESLGIDRASVTSVPTLFLVNRKRVVQFQGNIYNSNDIVSQFKQSF